MKAESQIRALVDNLLSYIFFATTLQEIFNRCSTYKDWESILGLNILDELAIARRLLATDNWTAKTKISKIRETCNLRVHLSDLREIRK